MSDAQENQGPAQPEGMSDEEYQKNLQKFEKVFRLMDSPSDGEAQNAFMRVRGMAEKLGGLSFGNILDMVGNGNASNEEELLQIIEEYRVANEQLKSVEGIVVQENERLNFLLRNFRDSEVQASGLDAEEFKSELMSALQKTEEVSQKVASLSLPQNQQELEEIYKMRVAEAMMETGYNGKKGFFEGILLWMLKKTGRDTSFDGVLKMQDLLLAQEKVIKDQSGLLSGINDMQRNSQSINEKLDLILSASAPQSEYHQALKHLRDAQLMVGDKITVETLQLENQDLKEQNLNLQKETNDIKKEAEDVLQKMQNSLDEARKSAKEAFKKAGKKKKNGSAAADADDHDDNHDDIGFSFSAPSAGRPDPVTSADGAHYKNMELQVAAQLEEINRLQSAFARHNVQAIFTAEEAALVEKLDRYQPLLNAATVKLDAATTALVANPQKVSFLRRMLTFSKKGRERLKINRAAEDIKTVAGTIGQTAKLVFKVEDSFNEEAQKSQERIISHIDDYASKSKEIIKDTYAGEEKAFRKRLQKIREEYDASFTQIETMIREKREYLSSMVERKQVELAKIERMERELTAKIAEAKVSTGTKLSAAAQSLLTSSILAGYLHEAVHAGDSTAVHFYLSKGADINSVEQGKTLLGYAVGSMNSPLVSLLLEKNANLFTRDDDGNTAFDILLSIPKEKHATLGYKGIQEMLMKALPDRPLKRAAETGDMSAEQIACAQEIFVQSMHSRDAGLACAALAKGADVNAPITMPDGRNLLPLVFAANMESNLIINAVMDAAPDIFAKTDDGYTVFETLSRMQWKSQEMRSSVILRMAAMLPEVDMTQRVAITPPSEQDIRNSANMMLILAHNDRNAEGMELAIAKGADINVRENESGQTFLMKAVLNEAPDLFSFLMSKGADPFLKDNEGHTIFTLMKKQWRNQLAMKQFTAMLFDILPGGQPQADTPSADAASSDAEKSPKTGKTGRRNGLSF